MSQDNVTCAKCDKLCGYDDGAGIWFGSDREAGGKHAKICEQCKLNLMRRFSAFFGLNPSSDEYGLDVEWHEADRIMGSIKREANRCIVYITTDKELYEQTKTNPVSILEG